MPISDHKYKSVNWQEPELPSYDTRTMFELEDRRSPKPTQTALNPHHESKQIDHAIQFTIQNTYIDVVEQRKERVDQLCNSTFNGSS